MKRAPQNLFELVPVRAVRFEDDADGRVVLLVPKFRAKLFVRFLVPRLSKPDQRVRLDAIGTFVWQQCDGRATVAELGRRAWERFGGERESLEQRAAEFVARLAAERCLTFAPRKADANV